MAQDSLRATEAPALASTSVRAVRWSHANGRRITIGLAAFAAIPLLYVLTFGPACWMTAQTVVGGVVVPARGTWVYWPLGMVASDMDSVSGRSMRWWITVGVRKGQSAVVPISSSGNAMILDAD